MRRINKNRKINKIYKSTATEQNKKYAVKKRKQIITRRLILLFAVTVAAVIFFIYARNMQPRTLELISFTGLVITGMLLIISGGFLIQRLTKKIDESDKLINSKNIFAAAAFLFFLFERIFFAGHRWIPFLIAFVISVTVVVYLYYLYQREFFWFSLFTAAGCFCLYFSEAPLLSDIYKLVFRILLAGIAVLIFAFALTLMKNKGRLKFKDSNIKILEQNAKYFQFFILAGFMIALTVLGFLPLTLVYLSYFYLICAMLGWFISVGMYFTVKMI